MYNTFLLNVLLYHDIAMTQNIEELGFLPARFRASNNELFNLKLLIWSIIRRDTYVQ